MKPPDGDEVDTRLDTVLFSLTVIIALALILIGATL